MLFTFTGSKLYKDLKAGIQPQWRVHCRKEIKDRELFKIIYGIKKRSSLPSGSLKAPCVFNALRFKGFPRTCEKGKISGISRGEFVCGIRGEQKADTVRPSSTCKSAVGKSRTTGNSGLAHDVVPPASRPLPLPPTPQGLIILPGEGGGFVFEDRFCVKCQKKGESEVWASHQFPPGIQLLEDTATILYCVEMSLSPTSITGSGRFPTENHNFICRWKKGEITQPASECYMLQNSKNLKARVEGRIS